MKFPGASAPGVHGVLLVAIFAATLSRCSAVVRRAHPDGIVLRAFEAKVYPVTKVVNLLRDMQKELEKEADEDEEIYDKMSCWCKTNNKEKTQAVADAQTHIAELETVIEESTARSSRLAAEIQAHEEDLAKSQKSLDEEAALRKKQAVEFTGEEKLMLQNIKALDSAIVVLSKHHGGASLLANDNGEVAQAMRIARSMMQSQETLLLDSISPEQRRLIMALPQTNQDPDRFANQGATFKQAYAPQSSEIFGILKQMKETFETNLSETQKEELANAKAFEELQSAKKAEIQATQQALEEKKVQLAETDQKNAKAKQDIEDTQESLSSDQQFLLTLQESCSMTDQEWQSRQKLRQEEIQAVAQAISILTADDARDKFSQTFNFLQEGSRKTPAARDVRQQDQDRRALAAKRRYMARVSTHLADVARKVHSPKLLALSTTVRLDPLTKVKEEIDKLITELQDEAKAETIKRDQCVDEKHQNQMQTEDESRNRENLESKQAALKAELSELEESLKTLKAEVAELNVQIKRAGEDREAENKDFQATIQDQRETQKLLQKALEILKAVYKPHVPNAGNAAAGNAVVGVAASFEDEFLQQPAPPPGFSEYGRNRAGGGVVGMIEQIINDAHHLEEMAVKDEQTAQQQYEQFVKDTNEAVKAKQDGIVNKGEVKAQAESKLITIAEEISNSKTQLEALSNTLTVLKQDCDFLLRNFAIRQEARDEEVEALREAKAVLSGMKLD
jgi:hypothetical protein